MFWKLLKGILSSFYIFMIPSYLSSDTSISTYLNQGMISYDRSNYSNAIENWKKASDLGNKEADFLLGFLYDGVLQNDEKAFFYFKKAALSGHVQAQVNVGARYEVGEGTERNNEKAKIWYSKAAYNQDPVGQFRLASLLQNIFKKNEESHFWFLKSAELGNPDAHLALATNFILGKGIKKNLIYAHMSCNIAAFLYRDVENIKKTIQLRSELEVLMNTDEVKNAEQLSRKCIDKKFKECFN